LPGPVAARFADPGYERLRANEMRYRKQNLRIAISVTELLPGLKQRPAVRRASGMRDRDARVAGLLYLGAVIGGIFTLKYVPDKINVPGNAVATAHNILTQELPSRCFS
jgi:hypothetical protein